MGLKSFISKQADKTKRWPPSKIIVVGFAGIILAGAILLYLPISHKDVPENFGFIDALFTATTSVCVTGLVTVTTATAWSLFGQIVILFLIQVGGLSFVTIVTFLAIYIGKKVTLKNRITVQNTLNLNSLQDMLDMVKIVIKGTLLVEGIGALLLTVFVFLPMDLGIVKAIYFGIFHAISAFCNAGIDLIDENSLIPFVSNVPFNIIIMLLIVIGGIGFTVWRDILLNFKNRYINKNHVGRIHLRLHSKLALISTAILILLGAIFFFFVEYNNPGTLGPLSKPVKVLASLFQSVTLRTAGFMSIDQGEMNVSSKLFSCIWMLIGGSPGGTAGGMKTVTVAIIFCSVWSVIKGKDDIEVMGRRISFQSLQKSLAIVVIMIGLTIFMTIAMSIAESGKDIPFIDLLFEVSSALGTVGLSAGWTSSFTSIGKFILILCMFIGRLGPMTIMLVLTGKSQSVKKGLVLPEADVLIG